MHQNSIMVVKPYKWEGMWVFDDEKTGLVRESFVASAPEILEALLEQQGIPVEEVACSPFLGPVIMGVTYSFIQ